MHLDIGDKVFYTKSTRLYIPAKVVGRSDEGESLFPFFLDETHPTCRERCFHVSHRMFGGCLAAECCLCSRIPEPYLNK